MLRPTKVGVFILTLSFITRLGRLFVFLIGNPSLKYAKIPAGSNISHYFLCRKMFSQEYKREGEILRFFSGRVTTTFSPLPLLSQLL